MHLELIKQKWCLKFNFIKKCIFSFFKCRDCQSLSHVFSRYATIEVIKFRHLRATWLAPSCKCRVINANFECLEEAHYAASKSSAVYCLGGL